MQELFRGLKHSFQDGGCELQVLDLSQNAAAGCGEHIARAYSQDGVGHAPLPLRVLCLSENSLTSKDAKGLGEVLLACSCELPGSEAEVAPKKLDFESAAGSGTESATSSAAPADAPDAGLPLILDVSRNMIGREGITYLMLPAGNPQYSKTF